MRAAPPWARKFLTTRARWIGAPSQITNSLPGIWRSKYLEKAHHIRPTRGALPHLEEELAGGRDAATDGQVIASEQRAQDRRHAAWRPGTDHRGQRIEGGLIDPDDSAL